jgi:hypothetical protein
MIESFPWLFLKPEIEYWKSCLFILDTNTLLTLYRVRRETRDVLLRVLADIKERLWIPHQVAWEFLKNRPIVISEQRSLHETIQQQVTSAINKVIEGIDPTPYAQSFAAVIQEEIKNVQEGIKRYGEEYNITSDEDSTLEHLTRILRGKVGREYAPDDLKRKVKEAKERAEKGIPPGIKDIKEKREQKTTLPDDPYVAQLSNVYGDILLWFQILDYCKEKQVAEIVFVTNDVKSGDWWRTHERRFRLGPRLELVEELYRNSKTVMRMYELPRFFERCQHFLNQDVGEEVVKELRLVREVSIETIYNELAGLPSKQLSLLRREVDEVIRWVCPLTEHKRIAQQSPETIADICDRELIPRMFSSRSTLQHRLKQLARAIRNTEKVQDETASQKAFQMLRTMVIGYFTSEDVLNVAANQTRPITKE